MKKFIARQPIFDRQERVFAYELLFRSGLESFFRAEDPDQASRSVMVDSFLSIGIEGLTRGKSAFINCTREILIKEYAALLPRDKTIIEILENVEPDEEVLAACLRHKRLGYQIALDDFVNSEKMKPFTDLADIIKVDFRATEPEECRALVRLFAPKGIRLLAEKIETRQEFEDALAMGYTYFQGYFFSKPETISSSDIPGYKRNYLLVLQAVNRLEPDLDDLERIIKTEVSMTYKLLRYLNSAYFGFLGEIHSIKHALTLLGLNEVRKWTSLVALAGIGEDKPEELLVCSVLRAKFCELLAPKIGLRTSEADLFLMGLLSTTDAILGRPMADILKDMPISENVKSALVGESGTFADVLRLALVYEKAEWEHLPSLAAKLHLSENDVPDLYLQAAEFAKQVFQLSK